MHHYMILPFALNSLYFRVLPMPPGQHQHLTYADTLVVITLGKIGHHL